MVLTKFKVLGWLAVAALVLGTGQTAAAQNYEGWLLGATSLRAQASGDWQVNLGVGFEIAPSFWGGADSKAYALPGIDIEWRGAVFASTQRGFGINLVSRRQTASGPRLTLDYGRKPTDRIRLTNTTTVKRSVELGWFFVHYTGPWRLEGDVRKGLGGGHKGLRVNLGAALGGGKLSEQNTLIIGGTLNYTGTKYNKAYYDLKGGGFTSIGVYADIIREVGAGGYVGFNVRADAILGAAKKAVYTENAQYSVGMVTGVRF